MFIRPHLALKSMRDLWLMRGQAFAIALVIAGGLATWMVSLSTMHSLNATMRQFYSSQRFADVFASAVRAPDRLESHIREINGVASVATRIRMPGRAYLAGFADSITAVALSIPDSGDSRLNRLYVVSGRLPEDGRPEAAVSEAFAKAHGLSPGDELEVVVRGKRMRLRISGSVASPEFIYQIAPGSLFPDHKRHVVVWLRERQLEAIGDMRGAFNEVGIRLGHKASQASVIDRLDRLLVPYGGAGAHGREDQASHVYLKSELEQLDGMARIFPLLFLGVATFLLAIVMGRQVRQQRDEVATLKAFGYGNLQIALGYLLLVLSIVAVGSIIGIYAGTRLSFGLGRLYAEYFRFPYILQEMNPKVVLSGVAITVAAAVAGCMHALRQAWKLTPAQAMRPESPERYARSGIERIGFFSRSSQTNRMIIRHLNRRPLKAVLTILGLATAVAILMVGNFQEDAIDHMIDIQFGLAAREDMTVNLDHSDAAATAIAIDNLPGVQRLQPFRAAGVKIRSGHRTVKTSLQAYGDADDLHRPLDKELRPIRMPPHGILLSEFHAQELGVIPGDSVRVEILEGRRPEFEVSVAGVAREYFGSSAYMHIDTLNRELFEPGRASGFHLGLDESLRTELDRALRDVPAIAAATRTSDAVNNFRRTMADMIVTFAIINTMLAGVIAFGVIYNSARLALSERQRELASLRVLGYTRQEVAWILNGELILLAILALPVGFALGYGFSWFIATRMTSELYRIPLVVEPSTYVVAASIAAVALAVSLWIVRRQSFRLDLIAVLKTRE